MVGSRKVDGDGADTLKVMIVVIVRVDNDVVGDAVYTCEGGNGVIDMGSCKGGGD